MKKHLFIFSLAMAALAANAQTKQPATITTYKPADLETVLYCVSENGKYAAGDFGGTALLDLETGEKEVHIYENELGEESAGVTAKGVTNDGTIVGTFGYDISSPGAIRRKALTNGSTCLCPKAAATPSIARKG